MKIRMKLLSDCIFGNGSSIPGGEDISVLRDAQGFPYYRGTTFKGIFREIFEQNLRWSGTSEGDVKKTSGKLFGLSGEDRMDHGKLVFSDFCLSDKVQKAVLDEIKDDPDTVFDTFTHLRTFTAIDDDGIVKDGSLRIARCVNRGIVLEADLWCPEEHKEQIKKVLPLVKWIGTMRSRGFGKVKIEIEEEE